MPNIRDAFSNLSVFASTEEAAILKNSLDSAESQMLLETLQERLDSWRVQLPSPTREQMLSTTHQSNRALVEFGNDTPQFWDGLESEWRRHQTPSFEPVSGHLNWTEDQRKWLDEQRRSGRIFKDFEEAIEAYERSVLELDNVPAQEPEEGNVSDFLASCNHVGPIGRGYFAKVTHYREIDSNRDIAVKELIEEKYAYRFIREIRITESLAGHPNIIQIIAHECKSGRYRHITLKAETNLYKFIKQHNSTLTLHRRLGIFDQILGAVKFAHSKQILHRDIAPTNVLVFKDDHVEVCDFGMGKDLTTLSNYTHSIVARYGQLYYVAPEQRDKLKDATARSDIYSLGKLLNFLLTGRDPDVLHACDFISVVEKATQFNADERYQTVVDFEAAYLRLKSLMLFDHNNPLPKTLLDIKDSADEIDWNEFHQLAVRGEALNSPYSEYVEPVIEILSRGSNLLSYFNEVGDSFLEFLKAFTTRLDDLSGTTGWPFSETATFAKFLSRIFRTIEVPSLKLYCLKEIWKIAYEQDQWGAQSVMKSILTSASIPEAIQTAFAIHILDSSVGSLPDPATPGIPRVLRQALAQKASEMKK